MTTETTPATATGNDSAYDALRSTFERAMQNALTARNEADERLKKLQSSQATARQKLADAEARAAAIAQELAAAENAARIALDEERKAKRLEPPKPIDFARAHELGQKLVGAFDELGQSDYPERDEVEFWARLADVGASTFTSMVADDARMIVLGVSSLLEECFFWRAQPQLSDDPRYESSPLVNATVKSRLSELRRLLAGEELQTSDKLESVGSLIAQGVPGRQICLMYPGFQGTREPAIGKLSRLIDDALTRAGFYDQCHGVAVLAGHLTRDDAWQSFVDRADQRRQQVLNQMDMSPAMESVSDDDGDGFGAKVSFDRAVARIERERRAKLRDELKRRQMANAEFAIDDELNYQLPL